MRYWIGWLVVSVACVIVEMMTEGFFMLWFGIGAAAAGIAAYLGASVSWQFTFFIGVSACLVLSTKGLTDRMVKKSRVVKTNVDALPGRQALVTEEIRSEQAGKVKIEGELWSARSADGTRVPAGVTVTIVKVSGVHVIVRPPE